MCFQALEPQDATVLCNLGNLKREQSDDLVGAELLYKRALAADPNHLQTLLSYGHQVALHSDDYDKAERLLEESPLCAQDVLDIALILRQLLPASDAAKRVLSFVWTCPSGSEM